MKKSIKLLTLLIALTFATNTFSEELGLKLTNLNSGYAPSKTSSKSKSKSSKSSGGGIDKGLIQMDVALNLGSSGPIYVGNRYDRALYGGYGGLVGFRPGFTFNIDVAVHPYVSVGGYFGLDGSVSRYNYYGYKNIGIGVGARAVFHIYQLIADKTSTKVDPGKLDFYFPFHIGGIIYVATGNDYGFYGGKRSNGGVSVGAGLGVRYYFTDHIGIMGEVGWNEMSVFKTGLAVKL